MARTRLYSVRKARAARDELKFCRKMYRENQFVGPAYVASDPDRDPARLEDLPEEFSEIKDKILYRYPLCDREIQRLADHTERLEDLDAVVKLNAGWRTRYSHITLDQKFDLLFPAVYPSPPRDYYSYCTHPALRAPTAPRGGNRAPQAPASRAASAP